MTHLAIAYSIPSPVSPLLSLARTSKVPNPKFLEIGCGTGAGANLITQLVPTAHYTAVDMQKAAIQVRGRAGVGGCWRRTRGGGGGGRGGGGGGARRGEGGGREWRDEGGGGREGAEPEARGLHNYAPQAIRPTLSPLT